MEHLVQGLPLGCRPGPQDPASGIEKRLHGRHVPLQRPIGSAVIGARVQDDVPAARYNPFRCTLHFVRHSRPRFRAEFPPGLPRPRIVRNPQAGSVQPRCGMQGQREVHTMPRFVPARRFPRCVVVDVDEPGKRPAASSPHAYGNARLLQLTRDRCVGKRQNRRIVHRPVHGIGPVPHHNSVDIDRGLCHRCGIRPGQEIDLQSRVHRLQKARNRERDCHVSNGVRSANEDAFDFRPSAVHERPFHAHEVANFSVLLSRRIGTPAGDGPTGGTVPPTAAQDGIFEPLKSGFDRANERACQPRWPLIRHRGNVREIINLTEVIIDRMVRVMQDVSFHKTGFTALRHVQSIVRVFARPLGMSRLPKPKLGVRVPTAVAHPLTAVRGQSIHSETVERSC